MHEPAVSGEHPNNYKFSSCSRDDIIPTVNSKDFFTDKSCGSFIL